MKKIIRRSVQLSNQMVVFYTGMPSYSRRKPENVQRQKREENKPKASMTRALEKYVAAKKFQERGEKGLKKKVHSQSKPPQTFSK